MAFFGVDISDWQAGLNPSALDPATQFFILKCCEKGWANGNGGVAKNFKPWADWCVRNGRRLGAYVFARDERYGSYESQARLFVDTVRPYLAHGIVLVLDWENTSYSSLQHDVAGAKRFLDEIKRLSGKTPMIYTSWSVTNEHDWSRVANAGYPLWGAMYKSMSDQWGYHTPSRSYSWGAWGTCDIRQYSSTTYLDGYGGHLDVNICWNDFDWWDCLAGGQAPQPVDPTHVDEDGWWGPATTLAMQVLLNSPYQDMKISGQYRPNWKAAYPAITSETLEFDGGSGTSWLVKKIQEELGADRDGVLGHDTVRRWQERLRAKGYTSILDPAGGADGVLGAATALCIQKSINAKSMF